MREEEKIDKKEEYVMSVFFFLEKKQRLCKRY